LHHEIKIRNDARGGDFQKKQKPGSPAGLPVMNQTNKQQALSACGQSPETILP
jgi:hypothetical protein